MRQLYYVALCLMALHFTRSLWANESVQKEMKIFGKTVSVEQDLSVSEDEVEDVTSESKVTSTSQVNFLGKKIEIVKNSVQYRVSENEGLSHDSEFFVAGKKVLAQSLKDEDGGYSYEVDIPANEIEGNIFSYSIGILALGVYSGVSYEGSLKSEVSSELLKESPTPAPDMNLAKVSAKVDLLTKGYIEGQVKVFFVKAAIGGSLNLIDGEASASVSVTPANISKPEVAYDGVVNLLSGSVYGYIKYGLSKHSHDFYTSKGHCHSFGVSSCPN